jgi:hypothetical protein
LLFGITLAKPGCRRDPDWRWWRPAGLHAIAIDVGDRDKLGVTTLTAVVVVAVALLSAECQQLACGDRYRRWGRHRRFTNPELSTSV